MGRGRSARVRPRISGGNSLREDRVKTGTTLSGFPFKSHSRSPNFSPEYSSQVGGSRQPNCQGPTSCRRSIRVLRATRTSRRTGGRVLQDQEIAPLMTAKRQNCTKRVRTLAPPEMMLGPPIEVGRNLDVSNGARHEKSTA